MTPAPGSGPGETDAERNKAEDRKPPKVDDKDDATWIVLLVVFGLMGLGGPLMALFLFWLM